MRLRRKGAKRQHGAPDTLVSTEKPLKLKWKPEDGYLGFWVQGLRGATTHRYGVDLTPNELAALVETALLQASTDRSGKALAAATGAYIRAAFAGDQPTQEDSNDDE